MTRTVRAYPHDWQLIQSEERHPFGDCYYAVDVYQCRDCGKFVEKRSVRAPAPGKCPGGQNGSLRT